MSHQQRLEKARAEFAWECIQDVKTNFDAGKKKEFASLARSGPSDIQINGLGQAIAFWQAKAKGDAGTVHGKLSSQVEAWLAKPENLNLANKKVYTWITTEAKTNEYSRATSETIALLVWLKRFAEAELA